ncbi:MAG: DUF2177 family protein [Gemmatimonadales bacterium]|nr:DUF2177 family protein [Gemmatimonadales bacterium]
MTAIAFLKVYAVALAVFLAMDLAWLGWIAKGFYQEQLGHLMRPDVRVGAAVLFYLIYVVAVVVLVVAPAIEQQSVGRAVALGALFGLAAYAAFDLTSLALLRDFPVKVVVVDLAWGVVLTATVGAAAAWAGMRWA